MGNAKARTIYENNLPDSFRRSQTDSYPFENYIFILFKYQEMIIIFFLILIYS